MASVPTALITSHTLSPTSLFLNWTSLCIKLSINLNIPWAPQSQHVCNFIVFPRNILLLQNFTLWLMALLTKPSDWQSSWASFLSHSLFCMVPRSCHLYSHVPLLLPLYITLAQFFIAFSCSFVIVL